MTRKDFVLIAAALRTSLPDEVGTGRISLMRYHKGVCENVASVLATTNDKFKYDLFMSACGHES